MFIAVIFGYVMTAVMAFCGIFGIVSFFQGDLQDLGAAGYIQGLAVVSWPLVAAAALFTLVQVAILLEKLVIYSSMPQANIATPPAGTESPQPTQANHRSTQSGVERNPAMTGSFFHIEPDSTPAPMELDSIAKLAHQTDCERTMPNTQPQEKSLTSEPENAAESPPGEQAENHCPGGKLSFFRVD